MKRKYRYSLGEMTSRLLGIAAAIKKYLIISTLSSIIGNMGHLGLMGFGAMYILISGNFISGSKTLYAVLTVLSALAIAVCRYLEGVFSHIGAYGLLARLRVHLFEQIDRISPAFLVERQKGDILSIAVADIETLEFFFAHTIGPMFTVILLPVTTLIVAWHAHPRYALILLPIYVLISIIIPLLALKTGRGLGMRYRESLGALKAIILESVYGIRDIQIFGYGETRRQEVLARNDRINQSAHGLVLHRQTVSSLPNFFVYLARILIVVTATILAGRGLHNPAGTILVSFVATASFSSTFSLTFVVSHLLETFAAAERLFIIEDTPPAVTEPAQPRVCGPIREIRFDDVSFRYPHTDEDILQHASFVIRPGETIGILGESGAGKSTLFRLLLRFYNPDSGSITFNGIDTAELSFHELYSRVAMLEQETYLFDATIGENIALAKPDASPEEIRTAARRAGIDEFIASLPDGYDTPMGQMSARLSGGERQRVGIARVMLADPDVIVMDEPTSSLDVLHEKELLRILDTEYQDKIVIIISHRMSTLTGCTRLYRMTGGQLAEQDLSILRQDQN